MRGSMERTKVSISLSWSDASWRRYCSSNHSAMLRRRERILRVAFAGDNAPKGRDVMRIPQTGATGPEYPACQGLRHLYGRNHRDASSRARV